MDPELTLDHGWSIGELAFEAMCSDASAISPRTIVEFGSGPSSVRLAQAFPSTRIFSVDDSAEFGGKAAQLVEKYGLADRVSVSIRPLTWQLHGGALYQSYQQGHFPEQVDVVVVDGPPGATRRGREAALYQVARNLRVGGRVYLDDYRRPAEQRIARNWTVAYPKAFRTWTIQFNHQIRVLEKVAETDEPRVHPQILGDVALANLRRAAGWVRQRVRAAL